MFSFQFKLNSDCIVKRISEMPTNFAIPTFSRMISYQIFRNVSQQTDPCKQLFRRHIMLTNFSICTFTSRMNILWYRSICHSFKSVITMNRLSYRYFSSIITNNNPTLHIIILSRRSTLLHDGRGILHSASIFVCLEQIYIHVPPLLPGLRFVKNNKLREHAGGV